MPWCRNLICFHKLSFDYGAQSFLLFCLTNHIGFIYQSLVMCKYFFLLSVFFSSFFSHLIFTSRAIFCVLIEGSERIPSKGSPCPLETCVSYVNICRICIAALPPNQTNSAKGAIFISGSSKSILEKKKLSWHSSLIQWWRLTWQIIPAMWKTEMDGNMPVFCCVKKVFIFITITMVCLATK